MSDLDAIRELGEVELAPAPSIEDLDRRNHRRRRRSRLRAAALIGVAGIVSVAAWPRTSPSSLVTAGTPLTLSELPQGISTRTDGDVPLFLVRDGQALTAYVARSTHLGEPVWWCPRERLFVSPAHGEAWDENGEIVAGPPPRGLDQVEVAVVGNAVRIDPRHIIRGKESVASRAKSLPPDGISWASADFCSNHLEAAPSKTAGSPAATPCPHSVHRRLVEGGQPPSADALPNINDSVTDRAVAVGALSDSKVALKSVYPTAVSMTVGPGFGWAWDGENGGKYNVVEVADFAIVVELPTATDCPTPPGLYTGTRNVPLFFVVRDK